LENWEELKEFSKNTYTEKTTEDYRENQLFSTKQSKVENVSVWTQRVQNLGSKFREAALPDCEQDEKAVILTIADKLRNICFVQGMYSDRIQTIVRSKNHYSFNDIAETALEEESAIFSRNERYKSSNAAVDGPRCSNCNKLGHVASGCYLRDRKDTRVKMVSVRHDNREKCGDMICYNCQGKGQMARHCRKSKRHLDKPGLNKEKTEGSMRPGNELQPSERGSRTTVHFTQ
jgi:hypothetical protein